MRQVKQCQLHVRNYMAWDMERERENCTFREVLLAVIIVSDVCVSGYNVLIYTCVTAVNSAAQVRWSLHVNDQGHNVM